MGRQFGWEASKIPRQVDFMLGLDTFYPLILIFVSFYSFFSFMRRSFGTGVDVGALNNNRQHSS